MTIPESVTYLGNSVFQSCQGLQSLTILSSNISSIPDYFAADDNSLESVSIPSSITSIGNNSFSSCTNLASIAIPTNVRTIGDRAFYSCTNLTSISIPQNASLTSVGNSAFSNCGLTSITLPSSVISIGDDVFYHCEGLESITYLGLSEVCSSSEWSFGHCSSLNTVCVPLNYNSSSLCSIDMNFDRSSFEHLQKHILCSEFFICNENGTFADVEVRRPNASAWEKQGGNGCLRNVCDGTKGNITKSVCMINDWEVCNIHNECEVIKGEGWLFVMDTEKSINIKGFNTSDILSDISNATGISTDELDFGVEMDDDGNITRLYTTVYNEENADRLEKLLNFCVDDSQYIRINVLVLIFLTIVTLMHPFF